MCYHRHPLLFREPTLELLRRGNSKNVVSFGIEINEDIENCLHVPSHRLEVLSGFELPTKYDLTRVSAFFFDVIN